VFGSPFQHRDIFEWSSGCSLFFLTIDVIWEWNKVVTPTKYHTFQGRGNITKKQSLYA